MIASLDQIAARTTQRQKRRRQRNRAGAPHRPPTAADRCALATADGAAVQLAQMGLTIHGVKQLKA